MNTGYSEMVQPSIPYPVFLNSQPPSSAKSKTFKPKPIELPPPPFQLVRKFAHSLLQCLDLLYRNKIIHCDMKPENVLLKQQGRSGIKVGTETHTTSH